MGVASNAPDDGQGDGKGRIEAEHRGMSKSGELDVFCCAGGRGKGRKLERPAELAEHGGVLMPAEVGVVDVDGMLGRGRDPLRLRCGASVCAS